MIKVYSKGDLAAVTTQKNKCLAAFFTVTGLYLSAAVTLFVFFCLEPYGSERIPYFKWPVYIITALYVIFAYVFMSVRFGRVNKYKKMLGLILKRVPTEGIATFMRFNSDVSTKDGVDLRSMTLVEWSEKEKEYMERYVMLDLEKPLPDFREGDEIHFKTYANILTQYEITNRTILTGTPFEQPSADIKIKGE